ncbi:hypothetical protein RB195_026321 [Necator americanus]|uniref:C2H2-type domain-containing protein n=1 Tax=Necator americanus TaxID=51031 RepID=A0ABR1EWE2_NECAM
MIVVKHLLAPLFAAVLDIPTPIPTVVYATPLRARPLTLLITTWPELTSKSKEEFGEWLADRGLRWKERLCPNCGNPVEVAKQTHMNSLHKG